MQNEAAAEVVVGAVVGEVSLVARGDSCRVMGAI